ncbi:CCA tRNA nucleotidyltransferase [Sediminibacillus albus]|nr:CCA tRNA nucleotidyltransferase [Sediminibacillus albus]
MDTFYKGRKVLETLESHGFQAYFVGGSVRDYLIGRSIGDIDITTSAKPEEVQRIFPKVIPVGIEHGTVIVRMDGESIEVTTFRVEEDYSDYRRPDQVHFVRNLEEDLARRDFTINAIAMDRHGNILDPFKGATDIKENCIQTVGSATQRFREDPLRMLRALRFASQLGFQLTAHTFSSLKEGVPLIREISIERTAVELEKLFSGSYVQQGIRGLIHTGLLDHLPIFREYKQLIHELNTVSRPFGSFREVVCLLVLAEPQVPVEMWAKTWKLSNRFKKETGQLLEAINYCKRNKIDRWLVYRLPPHLFGSFARVYEDVFGSINVADLHALRKTLPIEQKRELAVTGSDLVHLFPNRNKGPWINDYLQAIEKKVVSGELTNSKKALKEWVIYEHHPQSTD